jgi:UDP-N-acetylglucosamine transferase subunit ALG13
VTVAQTPAVFVTVGTDHHPFNRLIEWIDGWLAANRGVTALVQTGTSLHPANGEHVEYLGYAEMETAMMSAAAVVTHGGPGSIMLCRYLGKKPIVVPREHSRGEHVDDHQVAFCRRLANAGQIDLAETDAALAARLQVAVFRPTASASEAGIRHVDAAVERFEVLVDEMLASPSRRRLSLRGG